MKKKCCLFLAVLLMFSSVQMTFAYAYDGKAVLERAEAEIGKPYRWGTTGPVTYDACGLIRPDFMPAPPTGDSMSVIPLALCVAVSLGMILLLTRKKKA